MIKFLRGLFERSKISRNTTPKLVAFFFALILWLYVMSEVNPETSTTINDLKVELQNVEELRNSGLVIIGQEEFTVNAKVIGRRNEIFKIDRNDIKVTADLRGYHQGVNSIPLEISQPANVTQVEISPQQIKVSLDRVVKSQKIVEIVSKGDTASGYEIGDTIATPNQVLVEGPESKVNAVAKVIGEVNVDGEKESIRSNLPVIAVDNDGNIVNGVEVKSKYVNVYMPILKVRDVQITPQFTGEIKNGYKITSIEVLPKIVSLKGKEEEVNKYSEITTETINLEDLDRTLKSRVNLILPEGIETSKLNNLPEVTVNIEKIETKEISFNASQISVNNLDDNLTTDIGKLDTSIKINLSDVRSVLDNINRSDIELSIDGKDLKEGTQVVNLIVTSYVPVDSIEVLPSQVEIKVSRKDPNETEETMSPNTNISNNDNEADTQQ